MTHGKIEDLVMLAFTPEDYELLKMTLASVARDDSDKMTGATAYQIAKNGWTVGNSLAENMLDQLIESENAAPAECVGCHAEDPTHYLQNTEVLEGYCAGCWGA